MASELDDARLPAVSELLTDVNLAALPVPAQLERVADALFAAHQFTDQELKHLRTQWDERRGKVNQDDNLWEAWGAAFTEWLVVEAMVSEPPGNHGDAGIGGGAVVTRATRAWQAAGLTRASRLARGLARSHRSLFEVVELGGGAVHVIDLLGGAAFLVTEPREMVGVEPGDVAEMRLVGVDGEVLFGRTFIYHPKAARDVIVEIAAQALTAGRAKLDLVDHVAYLRTQILRFRHVPVAKAYRDLGRDLGRDIPRRHR